MLFTGVSKVLRVLGHNRTAWRSFVMVASPCISPTAFVARIRTHYAERLVRCIERFSSSKRYTRPGAGFWRLLQDGYTSYYFQRRKQQYWGRPSSSYWRQIEGAYHLSSDSRTNLIESRSWQMMDGRTVLWKSNNAEFLIRLLHNEKQMTTSPIDMTEYVRGRTTLSGIWVRHVTESH